mgnify:CR=1 FL=1
MRGGAACVAMERGDREIRGEDVPILSWDRWLDLT